MATTTSNHHKDEVEKKIKLYQNMNSVWEEIKNALFFVVEYRK